MSGWKGLDVLGSARPRVECCQPRRTLPTTDWQPAFSILMKLYFDTFTSMLFALRSLVRI